MESDIGNLREKLKQAGQEHVLAFWDELSDDEKTALAKQIENMNFVQIDALFENSKIDDPFEIESVSPIPYVNSLKMTQEEKERYTQIGEERIRNGEVAVISMAGGQRNKAWLSWA